VGVPQLAVVKYVDDGGKYVTIVQGAVPGVAPEAAVPPEIESPSLALQTVSIINCVPVPAVRAEC
jgi:hypothetical protein